MIYSRFLQQIAMYISHAMNIVVASLVADFLRAEIIGGREKITKLKIEMRNIRRAVINFTARSMTTQITTAEDRAYFTKEEERYEAMEDEIESIRDNAKTLATLEHAILLENEEFKNTLKNNLIRDIHKVTPMPLA